MSRIKKYAVLLMVLLVGWTTAPAAACVLPANGAMQPNCCTGMPANCTRMMSMDGSCCQLRDRAPAVETITPYTPARDLVLLSLYSDLEYQADGQMLSIRVTHRAMPTASPGLGAVLRI